MSTSRRCVVVVSLLAGSTVLAAAPPAQNPVDMGPHTGFAFRLYHNLAQKPGNLFVSPISISSALGMVTEGAAGDTRQQMSHTLGAPVEQLHASLGGLSRQLNAPDKPYQMSIANAVWVDHTFALRKEFLGTVDESYGAGAFDVDFAGAPEPARQRVNAWVEKQTRDRIKDLMPADSVRPDTRLVLTNAIYFKGDWATQFDKDLTKEQPFFLLDGSQKKTPLMHKPEVSARYGEQDGVQILDLPYKGRELSMVVLLPGSVEGFKKLSGELTGESFAAWTKPLRRREVNVFLPKFKMETTYRLNDTLVAMGMPLPFTPGRADFSNLTASGEGRQLHISLVIHKAFVEVNEEGTEAAAATGVAIRKTAVILQDPPATFRADRPFVFAIRHNASGAVLFLGHVVDPTE